MKEMKTLTFPNGETYEIVDAQNREDLTNLIEVEEKPEIEIPTMEDLNKKTEKVQIDYMGNKVFKLGEQTLNYKQLHDIHLVSPDFAFIQYGDRAYLLSYVQDDPAYMREMRFESVIATTDANLSFVKTSGIYVKSSDGINIAGVDLTDINSENKAYKATVIDDSHKNDVWYPSVNAVVDYVGKEVGTGVADLNLRVEKLEAAAEGNLYMFREDSAEAYSKTVPGDVMKFATLDKIGAKTLVWNQEYWSNAEDQTTQGLTYTCQPDKTWVVNGTSTGRSTKSIAGSFRVQAVYGHKYYLGGCPAGGSATTYSLAPVGYNEYVYTEFESSQRDSGNGSIVTPREPATNHYHIEIVGANDASIVVEHTNTVFKPVFVDLTAMFGAGNEPTAEEFRAMFPADYYPYSAPELMNFEPKEVVIRGISIHSERLVSGVWDANGQLKLYNNDWSTMCIQEKINVVPGKRIYFSLNAEQNPYNTYRVIAFDAGGNVIFRSGSSNNYYDVPDNCVAISLFFYKKDVVTDYKLSVSLSYSDIGYKESTLIAVDISNLISTYFPNGMKSAGNVYDSFETDEDGNIWAVQRVGDEDDTGLAYTVLADPIRTLVTDDFSSDLIVEAGGSLTFANQYGDDFRVPLPNTETYMIKLGGTA